MKKSNNTKRIEKALKNFAESVRNQINGTPEWYDRCLDENIKNFVNRQYSLKTRIEFAKIALKYKEDACVSGTMDLWNATVEMGKALLEGLREDAEDTVNAFYDYCKKAGMEDRRGKDFTWVEYVKFDEDTADEICEIEEKINEDVEDAASERIFSACEGVEVDVTADMTEADLEMIEYDDYDCDLREYLCDAVVSAATKGRFTWREAAEMRNDRHNASAPTAYAEITEDGRVIARMDLDYPWTW